MPDGSLHEETVRQSQVASNIVSKLAAIKTEDERMKIRLTVFSDVPADEIPDAFVKSRRLVGESEREILQAITDLSASGLVYLPIGFRPSGRSWPYMYALESTEERAFGPELQALQAKNLARPVGELERELKELEHRINYAQQGAMVLTLLL